MTVNPVGGWGLGSLAFGAGCFSGSFPHLLKLPARRGEAGPGPRQPRSSASTPSHTLHRKAASGRAICCPRTMAISWHWHRDMNPRNASFLKQCHSPLALRQYSFSVSPSGVPSIGSEYTPAIMNRLIRAGDGRVVTTRRNATLSWLTIYSHPFPAAGANAPD
jgi:hypothetical protein